MMKKTTRYMEMLAAWLLICWNEWCEEGEDWCGGVGGWQNLSSTNSPVMSPNNSDVDQFKGDCYLLVIFEAASSLKVKRHHLNWLLPWFREHSWGLWRPRGWLSAYKPQHYTPQPEGSTPETHLIISCNELLNLLFFSVFSLFHFQWKPACYTLFCILYCALAG